MHVLSTVNSQTKSAQDLPVIVLSCANRQKFVQRPRTYAELITLAEEKYHLKDQSAEGPTRLIFTTSTLDICQGKDIEIDESAYPLLAPVLDEIKVKRVKASEGHGTHVHPASLESTHAPPTPPVEIEPVEPEPVTAPNAATPGPSSHATSRAASKRPVADDDLNSHDYPPTSIRSIRSKTTRIEMNQEELVASTAANRTMAFKEPAQPHATPKAHGRSASPEKPVPATPTSRRGAGKKVVIQPQVTPAAPVEEEEEEEEIVEVPSAKAPASPVEKDHGRSRVKKSAKKDDDSGSSDRTATPRHPRTPQGSSRATPRPATAAASDERYTVQITGPGNEAEFKTRGKHTVKKVLAGACKNWGLDYERARLLLIIEESGEENRFICEPELTMAECGVNAGSRLEIEVDDEQEDESELEDEDDVKDDLLDFE